MFKGKFFKIKNKFGNFFQCYLWIFICVYSSFRVVTHTLTLCDRYVSIIELKLVKRLP